VERRSSGRLGARWNGEGGNQEIPRCDVLEDGDGRVPSNGRMPAMNARGVGRYTRHAVTMHARSWGHNVEFKEKLKARKARHRLVRASSRRHKDCKLRYRTNTCGLIG